MKFRFFLEQTEEQEENLKTTLARIPKAHRDLIKGYDFNWQCDNTLKNDRDHVGVVDPKSKTITIAAPWRYSREHTFLHELGHKVFEKFLLPNPKLLLKWKNLVNATEDKVNQNIEEIFCHAYAATYSKYPPIVHRHDNWAQFIKNL